MTPEQRARYITGPDTDTGIAPFNVLSLRQHIINEIRQAIEADRKERQAELDRVKAELKNCQIAGQCVMEQRDALKLKLGECWRVLEQAFSALDNLMGDSDLEDDDSEEMAACQAIRALLAAQKGPQ